jgi:hypothetical protein
MIVQLTARCAGFLEVPTLHRDTVRRGSSLVTYFHRTARDFLETEVTWSKVLLHTAGTDFEPSIAMMKSCLISLRMGDPKELTRDFLVYARHVTHVDTNLANQQAQYVLVDKFDELRNSMPELRPAANCTLTILELTTLYGLWGYVGNKLSHLPAASRRTEATRLLRYLLLPRDIYVKHRAILPQLQMVAVLLDLGASLYHGDAGLGPWGNTLIYATTVPCDSPSPMLHRYISIMKLLVLSGADPFARLPNVSEDALGIVEEFLVPHYPQESAELVDELHKARAADRTKATKRHKRRWWAIRTREAQKEKNVAPLTNKTQRICWTHRGKWKLKEPKK